jgi:hypothetical protein
MTSYSSTAASSLHFPRSWLITGFVTRLTRRVSVVEQELLTLPEHLNSPPVFSGIRVTRSLVLYVCFVDRCLSFYLFSFGHCVACSSSIYGFWLTLWYLQILLTRWRLLLMKMCWPLQVRFVVSGTFDISYIIYMRFYLIKLLKTMYMNHLGCS